MGITIEESGVVFGPFDEDIIFWIEKSKFYCQKCSDAKTVEFIRVNNRSDILMFVEAKESAPNIENAKNLIGVESFIKSIECKFYHSISMLFGLLSSRHDDEFDELSDKFNNIDISQVKIILTLVIPNFKDEWLGPLSVRLNKEFKGLKKAFGKVDIAVLNEKKARRIRLIDN